MLNYVLPIRTYLEKTKSVNRTIFITIHAVKEPLDN